MQGQPDANDQERALKVRALIAREATITQHGGDMLAMSLPGVGNTAFLSGDEMRRIIPGWPRPDEAKVPGGRR
ncbi:hypothetical protein VQH23_16185 [Pararoseomonas sp. SCSIO 73927]|uniref:hypothetical protein n=1 Tax=Pararoseomonas sp. SCSIO 73927 TaxID=3114537 RepID=UPI0030CA9599